MHIETRKRKKSTVYKVIVKDHGKIKTKTFKRKYDANQWGISMEALLKHEGRVHLSFKELSDEWMNNYAKFKKTLACIRNDALKLKCIIPIIGNTKIQDLSYHHIEFLIKELRNMRSCQDKTLNRYLSLTRTILNYGIERGDLLVNPIKKSHFFPEPDVAFRYWQKKEAEQFLSYVEEKYGADSQTTLIYKVILNTGLRWGEMAALKWDAIHFGSNPYITVRRSFCSLTFQIRETTKTNKIRHLGMNQVLEETLKKASRLKNSDCELVFTNLAHKPLCVNNFTQRHFLPNIRESHVSRIRIHDLRHTYASLYMMAGGNVYDLQKILGHSSVKTTMMYAHLAKDYILDKANVLVVGFKEPIASLETKKSIPSDLIQGKMENVISVNFRKS